MLDINVKYFNEDYERLMQDDRGDWIDLRVNSIREYQPTHPGSDTSVDWMVTDVNELDDSGDIINVGSKEIFQYFKGDILLLGLGIAMDIPEGYEALVVPRSSTFKHWGFIQTNGVGVIDNSFAGDNDEWGMMVLALKNGCIERHSRVCQFRVIENQPTLNLHEVPTLNNKSRGGFGTSGRK